MLPTPPPPRESVPCNLCAANETTPWARVGDAQVVRCRRCGLVYTNPRPVLQALTEGYEEEYSAQHQDPELLRQRRLMYAVERREILTRTHGGRFLDVGCGTGEFLAAMAGDFDVYGVDVSQTYIRHGQEQLGLANLRVGQLSEAGLASEFFEVVQMRGVLQHLPDPTAQLREAHRVLKPGGLLIISATPNIGSPAARVFREQFRLLSPDQMLYNFSPSTLRGMLDKTGFVSLSVRFPYLQTPYWHWYDGLNFAWLALRRLLGGEASRIKSPPFPGSMMTCYAVKAG